ncbi:hypothetical protein TD95_005198 [Thielaviopsis punctulata]|uniref:DDB1- and CUL4-associated factor 13 n=1 Tax=Thielaviopsis punctulata TaxID=72032 RepID=A0A0F4Z9C1_9PEZI|nr:hypothetical protein TD95_005198 [Thielaviopsis punctulata]
MKIKTLSHSGYKPGATETKVSRNLDPSIHPFAKAREYTRTLNAVKLERMFAAPFLGQLGEGHVEGVYAMKMDPNSLDRCASGSGDGIIKVWDITSRSNVWNAPAHDHIVKGLAWTADQKLLSCSADRSIKLWDPYNTPSESSPISTWLSTNAFTSISHHRSKNAFAAASNVISIYDLNRHSAAPEILKWPNREDTITAVEFNPTETSVLAACATDRSVIMGDLRTGQLSRKFILKFASNAVSWNPMESYNMAVASEDHNVYIFDTRMWDRALNVLQDHVAAVMDVSFSPTGQELVSASWDRTIRVWNRDKGHSRDVYHTKRMQRVLSAEWTPDSKFLLSGSDDGNIRLWRANASKREGVQNTRQRQALEYNQSLIEKYGHMPEIRRIQRHRHVPHVIKKAGKIKREELNAIKRREENERKHSKKQFTKRQSEREKMILAKVE